jgi:hypothetical protein
VGRVAELGSLNAVDIMTESYVAKVAKYLPSFGILVIALGLAAIVPAISMGGTFAGVPIAPGGTVRANVPLSNLESSYASEGLNRPPPYAVAVLAVPPAFDPKKSWPVLVAFSSSDNRHQNRDALISRAGLCPGLGSDRRGWPRAAQTGQFRLARGNDTGGVGRAPSELPWVQ